MMGRKRRCPGCKTFLSSHSFGPASKNCDGAVAAVAADQADETDAVAISGDVVDVDTVAETNEASLPPASELSSSLAAKRERNQKHREELVSLQREKELQALEDEGEVLRATIQQKRAALSKASKSSSSPPVPSVQAQVPSPEACSRKTLDDLRKDENLQDRVAQQLAQLAVGDGCSSSDSDADDGEESDGSRSRRPSRRAAGKSLRSGKIVKPTSKVVRPQLWP